MLGAWTLIPIRFTRLTIGSLLASPGAYPVGRFGWVTGPAEPPRMAIPHSNRGKSLADDLARTRYCKRLSGLVLRSAEIQPLF